MVRYKLVIFGAIMSVLTLLSSFNLSAQGQIDDGTRAVFIFDIAKYIDYGPGFSDSAVFKIGILDKTSNLFWEMGNLAKTRTKIQDKPVQLVVFRDEDKILHTQLLYVNKASGFNLNKVKSKLQGHQTLLMTEGYEFHESMVNCMGLDGKFLNYSVNEDMIKSAGMTVNSNLLFQAVKTKEDWENMFGKASEQIVLQRDTIREQLEMITTQKAEILRQKALLDSLDRQIIEKEKTLAEKQRVLDRQFTQISRQQGEITVQKRTISEQQKEVQIQQDTLASQKAKINNQLAMIDEQLKKISEQESKIRFQLEAIEKQKLILYFVVFALVLVSFLGYYIYRGYRIKKEANFKLEEKNRTISAQKDEIEKQRDLAAAQRDQIAYQKKHITDSILYAKRIQTALIPSLELFSEKLEHFVLYKPLAIVSGDFYWVSSVGRMQVIICADCTGHGVPGAFMSMLGITMLNEIVQGKKILMPDQIIENLREGIIRALKQVAAEDSVKDGMDIEVCLLDFDKNKLWFSGANNPLYLVRNGELMHYRADKMPVAIHYKMTPFTLHEIDLQKGDAFYIFTDGYVDQFGGPKEKKFMSNQLKETLMTMNGMSMIKQGEKLDEIFEKWRGDNPQVDDVTVIGVRY
ncbi:MAG TPA: YfiR/HmsC family protein [Bacteroidales bacterium]|nr:YfiR/HmsC family protein [Bacteroidales bacterium]